MGISTSGNSKNVLNATVVARALGYKGVGLSGRKGGDLAELSDVVVKVPEVETYMIQELHLPIYHCWCLMLGREILWSKLIRIIVGEKMVGVCIKYFHENNGGMLQAFATIKMLESRNIDYELYNIKKKLSFIEKNQINTSII